LGITQFLGPVLMIFLGIKLLIISSKQRREIVIPFVLFSLMLIFLLSSLISGLHIREEKWRLVFLRNFVVYVAAISLFLVIMNITKSRQDLLKIIRGLNFMVFSAALIGLLVILDIVPFDIGLVAPVSSILPENIKDSEFFYKILHPAFGGYLNLELFNIRVRRISSVFPYANTFAAALVLVLPFQLFLFQVSRGWKRIFAALSLGLAAVNLFFTFSRSAALALSFGFLYLGFLQVKSFLRFLQRPLIIFSTVFILLLFFFILRGPLLESKSSSTTSRTFIYEKTIESWKESPVFGWGTNRNMEVMGEAPRLPPLGSHSYLLTILYNHGFVGLILFSLIIGMIFGEIHKITVLVRDDEFLGKLGLFAGWAFFMNLVQAIFNIMDHDVVVLFLIWMNWGLIVAIRIMLEKKDSVVPVQR